MPQNVRYIQYSTANDRKSKDWKPIGEMSNEFVTHFETPSRSTETLSEYLQYPKSQQDAMKDVGAYVCASLNGSRRQIKAVKGIDMLTLDIDNVPPGGVNEILQAVDALGCWYILHSTRKHEPSKPRLRLITVLTRKITVEEYEPIARKLAIYIGIDKCDPVSFRANQLMYWPSCCADSQYVFRHADRPFINADKVLSMYKDWSDIAEWPRAAKEEKQFEKRAATLEDPTEKKGIIGAFCRTYDIFKALDELLPGVYVPCSNYTDRFTYANGSTAGGAVVYDDGRYLYSHHATDPCGNKEVNAFDLVRLHKFGGMDDEAEPRTPNFKLPSYKAMTSYARGIPEVEALFCKERGEELLEDFGATTTTDEETSRYFGSLKGKVVSTDIIKSLLDVEGIKMRDDEICKRNDLTGYPDDWSVENSVNNLPVYVKDRLLRAEVKGVTKSTICDCLDVIADERRYNPVLEMLKSQQWDGIDRISEYLDIIGLTDPFYQTLVYKWLVQCVAMACNDPRTPQSADGALVYQGAQGVGKTSSLREIVPNQAWFKGGADLDPKNKDTIIQATSCWICELGELDRVTKREQAPIKAIITAEFDNYRAPYAHKAVRRPRRTSFCGTVNQEEYLADVTGNRRFWTVKLTSVDLEKLFSLSAQWKIQLWVQTYLHYSDNPQGFRLTGEERNILEKSNFRYSKTVDFELEIRRLFNYDLPAENWGRFSAAELTDLILPRPAANKLGLALAKIEREDPRIKGNIVKGFKKYTLPILNSC